ncbi:redox-sensing transcriptional repressor Rex [[Clostridium] aminophilum]|uniref:redox-sensing transcriptional repressor Rex n=1 Tax=[Clostridium] aminophilum TaxID=1526 RepID=UPI0026ED8D11|nr:redox-sensing transcriptional repressor Rex [[Clostridium] aminophilum]MDD6196459.1 redox-sensing transcriptional repressor Rex [[Clostridium] aminophilum]
MDFDREKVLKVEQQKTISKAVITRLPRYYRYLGELIEEGVERISSNDLSVRMKVTASQIRQDLNNFGGFGQQGYGYNVKYLYSEIAKILGIDRQHNLIIIGAGNLGQAIANYANFEKRGFVLKGMFDVNPRLVGLVVRGVEIRGIDDLETFIHENNVQIAALTIPKSKAEEIAQRLVNSGIKAIWNFAHVDLQVPDDVVVENVHLSESLMRLSYRVCSLQDRMKQEAEKLREMENQ